MDAVERSPDTGPTLWASFYATLTPNFNPRYGLPAVAVGHMTLLTLAVSSLFRRKESPETST
jgi:hypothetical protein